MFDNVDVTKIAGTDVAKLVHDWGAYIGVLALSIWGGIVRFLGDKEAFSWRSLVAQISSSSFAGMMTFFACQYTHVPGPLVGVLCGVAGYIGTPALLALAMKLKMVKNFLQTTKE